MFKVKKTNANIQELRKDIAEVIRKHAPDLEKQEMLAVASVIVGVILANQDQFSVTPALAMEIVRQNIEAGNKAVIDDLLNSKGGNA